jgi:ketosteroid isomerase-like protein
LDQGRSPRSRGTAGVTISQEKVDNVRELVAAFNRGDADAFAALCVPDVEWEDAIFWTETSRTFRGREEVRSWFAQMREPWEDVQVAAEDFVEAGEDTLVHALSVTSRGKGSGVETKLLVWQVMAFTDGKTATRKVFRGRDEALEAAGLSE